VAEGDDVVEGAWPKSHQHARHGDVSHKSIYTVQRLLR
jgi:hypothetical protein